MRWVTTLAFAILTVTSLPAPAAAGGAPVPSTAPPLRQGSPPLAEAVHHVPTGARSILFTDWAAIKVATGHENVTSATPIDRRMEAMLEMSTEFQPLAAFALGHFVTHADVWGWDSTDLDWEASFVADGPPVAVLRFRDDFELAPVREAYEERGFIAEPYGDATILSHELDLGAEWLRGSDFGVLNTAFLDDGRTLVLSSGIEAVRETLDALSDDAEQASPARLVTEALGAPLTAGIDVEQDACLTYDPKSLPGSEVGPNDELLEAVGPLGSWEGLGIGIDSTGQGRFVLVYGTPGEAASDLEGRVRLAEDGVSLVSGEPYADHVFRVLDSAVEGSAIRFDVEPVDGQADRLSRAFMARDLVFAGCG